MDFRTLLPTPKAPFSIAHQDQIMCIGSCFANNMGTRLDALHFQNALNPFGISYNPISISNTLKRILNQQLYTKKDLLQHNELWHSFDHHSVFSHRAPSIVLEKINTALQTASDFIKQTNRLIITLGTAHVHQFIETKKIVANCHKIPSKNFSPLFLHTDQIQDSLHTIISQLKTQNPPLEVILTVSPIRHIRLGLVENQRSKATLVLAAHQLVEQLDFVHYFPAYELVLDDLRDYRFYEADMIHPNQQAIDYVWERFSDSYFESETLDIIQKIKEIQRACQHRAFNPDSQQHQQFLQTYLGKIDTLEERYLFLKLKEEREQLNTNLVL